MSRDGAIFTWHCDRTLQEFEVQTSTRKHEGSDEEETLEKGFYIIF